MRLLAKTLMKLTNQAKHPERSARGIVIEAGIEVRAQSKDAKSLRKWVAFFDFVRQNKLRECCDPKPHSAQNA